MSIRRIRSPQTSRPTKAEHSLFLAGGITNCEDWQENFLKLLEIRTSRLLIFNPRQIEYRYGDEAAAIEQIHWEHEHLQESDAIAFWFCAHEIQPISLFELGKYFENDGKDRVFVGASLKYPRRLDVITQLELSKGQRIEIVDNLPALADQVALWNGVPPNES